MFDILGKLNDMKRQVEEARERLKNMTVQGEAEGGAVRVSANGVRQITDISISAELLGAGDSEVLEDLVTIAVNRALEEARKLEEQEIRKAAGGMLPPGLGF